MSFSTMPSNTLSMRPIPRVVSWPTNPRHDHRAGRSEVSTVDTSFLLVGFLTAAAFFDQEKEDEREYLKPSLKSSLISTGRPSGANMLPSRSLIIHPITRPISCASK